MKYNVKWIISGNIDISSISKEAAEKKVKVSLEKIIKKYLKKECVLDY